MTRAFEVLSTGLTRTEWSQLVLENFVMNMKFLKQVLIVLSSVARAIHCAKPAPTGPWPIQRPGTSTARETVASAIAATRCTDRFVSGTLWWRDPCRFHVSNADCEAERWMQSHSELKGDTWPKRSRQTGLGSECEGMAQFPSVLEKHGTRTSLGLHRLAGHMHPAAGCDGRRADHAPRGT